MLKMKVNSVAALAVSLVLGLVYSASATNTECGAFPDPVDGVITLDVQGGGG